MSSKAGQFCYYPCFVNACWLLRDFSDQCEDVRSDGGPVCF